MWENDLLKMASKNQAAARKADPGDIALPGIDKMLLITTG